MDAGGFFRGTSAEQDNRFANKQKKLLSNTKFADELNEKVDMKKVKLEVIKPWIARRVTEILGGLEDDVLINYIFSLLEQPNADAKNIQISLTPFLERNVGLFMKELWCLLLSAQKSIGGIPEEFLKQKQEEVRKKKIENDRIQNELKRKRDDGSSKIEESDGRNDRSGIDKENGSDTKENEENDRKRSRKNSSHSRSRSKSPHRDIGTSRTNRRRHRSRSPRRHHDREREREREKDKQRDKHSSEKDENSGSKKNEEKHKHRDEDDKDKHHHHKHHTDSKKDKTENDSKNNTSSMVIDANEEKKNESDTASNNMEVTDQVRKENELREKALQSMQFRKSRKE